MDIAKLISNIEQIRTKFDAKRPSTEVKDKSKLTETEVNDSINTEFKNIQADTLITYAIEYKKWAGQVANHVKDIALQKLPIEYYQIVAEQYLNSYKQAVQVGIPRLLELDIVDKEGKLK